MKKRHQFWMQVGRGVSDIRSSSQRSSNCMKSPELPYGQFLTESLLALTKA